MRRCTLRVVCCFLPPPLPWLLLCARAARAAVSCRQGCGTLSPTLKVSPGLGTMACLIGSCAATVTRCGGLATGAPRTAWAAAPAPTGAPGLARWLRVPSCGRPGDHDLSRAALRPAAAAAESQPQLASPTAQWERQLGHLLAAAPAARAVGVFCYFGLGGRRPMGTPSVHPHTQPLSPGRLQPSTGSGSRLAGFFF